MVFRFQVKKPTWLLRFHVLAPLQNFRSDFSKLLSGLKDQLRKHLFLKGQLFDVNLETTTHHLDKSPGGW